MENFEFKSQVATSIERSKRLLELELKKETADCHWFYHDEHWELKIGFDLISCENLYPKYYIPAWSLARLFEISNSAIHIGLPAMIDRQQPYDYLITTIEDYIKRDCFNQDYLEEKK